MFEILKRASWTFLLAGTLLTAPVADAAALEPVTYPASSDAVAFNVVKGGHPKPITIEQLEQLGLYRVSTTSPFEQGELTFEGVLFRDVLKLVGMENEEAVTVRATDDYVQIVPREDWSDGPLLLATRQDGKLLTRRTQGPTRLVYPLRDYPAFDNPIRKPRWVWLIKSLESSQ